MVSKLLETKLHQPSPPSKRVQRTQLVRTLTENLEAGRILTLVSAPAGFGKTTLVSEWLGSLHLPVAWLSLDRADDDPGRFFAYLVAALQQVDGTIGQEIEEVLHSGQRLSLQAIATSLVNDILAAGVRFILVLDDFQVIQDRAILGVLETVLSNPPGQLHLVLVTREDPLLPLSRLRANNQMTEIRAGELRFSEDEVELFLNEVMGLSLSSADIALMESRTEGWAAGLQLAAIAMADRADCSNFILHLSGSYRYILSYLVEEVLSRQPENIQLFLLQTSILDRLCGELCDTVTGQAGSQGMLERCFHANLFLVSLDDEGRWYRYHHLFRDLLQNQQGRLSKQAVLELHRRASQWYAAEGMAPEAIGHALAAADYGYAVQLLEANARDMIMQGYLKSVEGWMQALPVEWQSHNPRANLAFAWMHLLRGSYEKIGAYLERAGQAIWEIDLQSEAGRSLRAEWLSLQATFLNIQGKVDQTVELANQALQWAGKEDYYVRSLAHSAVAGGYRLLGEYAGAVESFQLAIQNSRAGRQLVPEMLAVGGLTVMAIQHGQLHFAYETGTQAIERLEREGVTYSPMAGVVHSTMGLACYEWNQLEKAGYHLKRGIQLSSLSGHNASLVYAMAVLGRVYQAQGDSQAAARIMQEAVNLLPSGLPAWLKPDVASHLAAFYLSRDNAPAAQAVLNQLELPVCGEPGLVEPLTRQDGLKSILYLKLLLHKACAGGKFDDLQKGIDFAAGLVELALQKQMLEVALHALLLRAQMLALQDNTPVALADLCRAVELAEPESYMRIFLDESPLVESLLKRSLSPAFKQARPLSDRQESFIRLVLASSGAAALPSGAGSVPSTVNVEEGLVEPLTTRELDVLRLMAEGLKYQEIAGRLFITLNTVRFYVKEIYGKLGANNRTRAIQAARRQHLI